ncbi:MAG: KOW domain-containing RNA-binding protein [Clostridia bacterium]
MEKQIELGSVVYSKAGRDSGRFFTVVEITDADFVKIADGKLRKLASPKKKRIKHLKSQGVILAEIAEKLVAGEEIKDAEVRKALYSYNGTK